MNTHKSALKILQYLEQNPEAMDTDTAISDWWIFEKEKITQSGLDFLSKNKVIRLRIINQDRYYSLRGSYKKGLKLKNFVISKFKINEIPGSPRSKEDFRFKLNF